MNFDLDNGTILLVVLLAGMIGLLLLISAVQKYNRFKRDLDYINEEIHRTVGTERQAWKERKRKLWLSLIPFYRGW